MSFILPTVLSFLLASSVLPSETKTEGFHCNGILEGQYGRFRYTTTGQPQPFQGVSKNACIWVIHANKAHSVVLTLEELGGEDATVTVYPHGDLAGQCKSPTRLNGSLVSEKNTFPGDALLVIASAEVTSLAFTWDSSGGNESLALVSSTDFVQSPEGSLVWRPMGAIERFLWIVDSYTPSLVKWTSKADLSGCHTTVPCTCLSFTVLQVDHQGNIIDLVRSCGRSAGEVDIYHRSPLIVFGQATAFAPGSAQVDLSWSSGTPSSRKLTVEATPTVLPHVSTTNSATGAHITTASGLSESTPHILIGTDAVKAFSPATSNVSVVLSEPTLGIAYDARTKKIYSTYEWVIRRSNLDGSAVETVFNSSEYSYLEGLSIDSITGNLYVATAKAYILVCNTSTSLLACTPVVKFEGFYSESNPALDSRNGIMYLSTYNPPRIWRMGMDGSNVQSIYNGKRKAHPINIMVDGSEDKLYWTDWSDKIWSSDVDGLNITTFVELPFGSKPYGIVKLGDRIYWGNYGTGTLQSCDNAGQDIHTHFTSTARIFQLALVSSTEELGKTGEDVSLEDMDCSHIRVPTPAKSFRCLCPSSMKLLPDNTTCTTKI